MLHVGSKKSERFTLSHAQGALPGKVVPFASVVEQGQTNLLSLAATAPDLRTLCLFIVQTFVENFDILWAEISVPCNDGIRPFALRWTASERPPHRLTSVVTLQLRSKAEIVGTLRFGHAARMKRAQRAAIAKFANEATKCVRRVRHIDTPAHPTPSPGRLQLAAEIHHGIGHYLANAIMRLKLCQQCLVDDPTRAEELLRTSLTCAEVAMDTVRTTIRSLGGTNAQAPQFTDILHSAIERLKIMTPAQFHLDIDLVRPLPPAMVPGIAAVACEALTNAVKHADAKNIFLKLENSDGDMMLRVIDDGKGFDEQSEPPSNDPGSGFGLSLIRDQVQYLGGTLQIQSTLGQGTRVMVQINHRQDAASFQDLTNALK